MVGHGRLQNCRQQTGKGSHLGTFAQRQRYINRDLNNSECSATTSHNNFNLIKLQTGEHTHALARTNTHTHTYSHTYTLAEHHTILYYSADANVLNNSDMIHCERYDI